ncbi:hypothetical protein FE257_008957 [Aspergillus nanangensis]|uniref:Uncharacterized protein n=1 Tax=Aspergillus nanangensis TaxID=2582783 RepID=A0AAD4CWG3_ASPNN|nr:hypothetical protein FE257_008957 [Aspergillus nanangensis]
MALVAAMTFPWKVQTLRPIVHLELSLAANHRRFPGVWTPVNAADWSAPGRESKSFGHSNADEWMITFSCRLNMYKCAFLGTCAEPNKEDRYVRELTLFQGVIVLSLQCAFADPHPR